MDKSYFALKEPEKLVSDLNCFIQDWTDKIGSGATGLSQVWKRNGEAYYANILDADTGDGTLKFEGEQGELLKIAIPQARSVFRQFVGLVTKQRLNFKSVARSTDAKTLNSARLGDAVIENLVTREKMDGKAERLAEEAGIVGAAYMKTCWRSDRGSIVGKDGETGGIRYTGDVAIEVVSACDVLFDYQVCDFDDLDWVLIRTKKNKWDLIAQYPNLEKKILDVEAIGEEDNASTIFRGAKQDYEDLIYVYEFYHKDSPAVNGGRITVFANQDCIFADGANDYGFLPLDPMVPEKIMYTGLGYPFFSNLLPIQEAYDAMMSIPLTNAAAFGVQSVLVPKGADLSVHDIGPMKFLNYMPQNANGGGKPEALQLTATPPEVFKYIDVLRNTLNDLSMVSSVLRGQPPAGVTAASAISTLSANSLQALESFSKALTSCLEGSMTKAIQLYKRYAEYPQVVEIIGPRKTYIAKDFVGKDLENISRIRLVLSNPLSSTPGGRREIAESLLKTGLIKRPEQYFTVLETGNLEQLYDDEVDEQMNIEAENDMLREGKAPAAIFIDDHARHILCHKAVLNDPLMRLGSDRVELVLAHIQEHVELARNADPFLTAMLMTGRMPQGGPPPEPGPQVPQGGEMSPVDEMPEAPQGDIPLE